MVFGEKSGAPALGAFSHIDGRLQKYLDALDLNTVEVAEPFEHRGRLAIKEIEIGEVYHDLIASFGGDRRGQLFDQNGIVVEHVTLNAKYGSMPVREVYLRDLRGHFPRLDTVNTQNATLCCSHSSKFPGDEKDAGKYQKGREDKCTIDMFAQKGHGEQKPDKRLKVNKDRNC